MDDLQQAYTEAHDALPACPTAGEIRRFRENRLEEELAFQVEFHLNDCAECIQLMERLETPAAADGLSAEEESRFEAEIAERLDLGRPPRQSVTGRVLSWLWTIRTPLYVPAAAVLLILALVLLGGPGPGPSVTLNPGVLPVKSIFVDQAAVRSGEPAVAPGAIVAGDVVLVEVFLDGMDHRPGGPVSCTVLDGGGDVLFSSETTVLEDYSVRIVISVPEPGQYTLEFSALPDGALLESVPVTVLAAD